MELELELEELGPVMALELEELGPVMALENPTVLVNLWSRVLWTRVLWTRVLGMGRCHHRPWTCTRRLLNWNNNISLPQQELKLERYFAPYLYYPNILNLVSPGSFLLGMYDAKFCRLIKIETFRRIVVIVKRFTFGVGGTMVQTVLK